VRRGNSLNEISAGGLAKPPPDGLTVFLFLMFSDRRIIMNLPWKKSSKKENPKANAGVTRADFTLYFDGSNMLLRAENPAARRHVDDNVAQYARWVGQVLDG
jgi:hypothetical protein